MNELISYEVRDRKAYLTLNRPDRLNAITAELARRWNFPAEIVRALDGASDPMATKPFDRLAAVVHLAMLLADMPPGGPEMLDALPGDVVKALQLSTEWMSAKFPAPDSFIDLD